MRREIAVALDYGQKTIKNESKTPLLVLEKERISSSFILELLLSCGISYIDCLSKNMNTMEDFANSLEDKQAFELYIKMLSLNSDSKK